MRIGMNVGMGVGIGTRPDASGAIAATLNTLDLDTPVETDGTRWTATLTWSQAGAAGNAGVLSLSFRDADPASIEVRDNERHNGTDWESAPSTVGVLVLFAAGIDEVAVGEIEAAINAGSALAQVTTPDLSSSKNVTGDMDAVVTQASFSGGLG